MSKAECLIFDQALLDVSNVGGPRLVDFIRPACSAPRSLVRSAGNGGKPPFLSSRYLRARVPR